MSLEYLESVMPNTPLQGYECWHRPRHDEIVPATTRYILAIEEEKGATLSPSERARLYGEQEDILDQHIVAEDTRQPTAQKQTNAKLVPGLRGKH